MDIKVVYRPGALRVTVEGPEDSPELRRILALLQGGAGKLWLQDERRDSVGVAARDVVWAECVDDRVFVYTESAMYQANFSLSELEARCAGWGLFRCNKSTVVNLHSVSSLACRPGGRIGARLQTGEKLMISRRYAPALREKLQGGI